MKTLLKSLAWSLCLAVFFILNPGPVVQAEEVDLSCMKHRVRTKIQVSNSFREFDVIVENRCPGPVYWSMCIERLDPSTQDILETLEPSGQVRVEKKTRVNLRMNRVTDETDPVIVFEEFYLNVAYALNSNLQADCVAKTCEAKKRDLRKEFRANDKLLQNLHAELEAQISVECPQSGWAGNDQADCEADIRQSRRTELDELTAKKQDLENQLAAVEPENCQVH